MKKLKFLFFVSILFLSLNVSADTSYDMTSRITSPVNYSECGAGSYTGVELNGATNCWNTNTRYQGTLNRIYFNLPAPTGTTFEGDTSYRLTLNMATDDWRNNFGNVVVSPGSSYTNNFVDTFSFVSYKQINITFTVPYSSSVTYQSLWVNLPAKSSSHLITGVSNWNLNKVTLTKLTTGSGGGSTTPSGPSTTWDDTGIINNSNENTQNIIDNNNTNTQDIIDNNNTNTQDIIDNNNKNFSTVTDILGDCYYNLMEPNDVNATSSNGVNYSPVRNYSDESLEFILLSGTATSVSFYRIYNGTFRTYFDYYIYQNNFPTGVELYCADGNDNRYYTTIPSNTTINNCYIRVQTGTTLNNLKVYPQFSLYQNAPYTPAGVQKCFSKLDDLRENQNSNTQDIINNQNSNAQQTQETINNNLNTCKEDIPNLIGTISGKYLYCNNSKCSFQLNNSRNVLIYEAKTNTNYRFKFLSGSNVRIGSSDTLYDDNVTAGNYYLTEGYTNSSPVVGSEYSFTTFGKYIYVYLQDNGSIQFFSNGQTNCTNKLDDMNNYLTDDTDPVISDSALNDVFGRVHFHDPLSYLLTLPVQLINKIVSMSDSCLPIDLGSLYGVHLTLPCIYLENYLGSDLWNILDVILSVGLLSVILKNFYDTISNLLTLGGEKEAKEKFSMPTPMDFLAMILGGDNR